MYNFNPQGRGRIDADTKRDVLAAVARGMSKSEAARKYGVSRDVIRQWLATPAYSPAYSWDELDHDERYEIVFELLEEGYSQREISVIMGVRQPLLHTWLKKTDYSPMRSFGSKEPFMLDYYFYSDREQMDIEIQDTIDAINNFTQRRLRWLALKLRQLDCD